MDLDARKARVKEFHDVLEKAMSRYSDVLLPAKCKTHGEYADDDCDPAVCEFAPVPAMLRTWALVYGVEELEPVGDIIGINSVDTFTPEGSMAWEVVGLLEIAKNQIAQSGGGVEY